MKRILSMLLALALIFSFAACGKKDTSSDVSVPVDSAENEDYAAVLSVKINPEFEVFLTKTLTVLRVKAVNDDAKSFEKNLDSKEDDLKKVIKNIITKANEKGFIKKDATVTLDVKENKSESIDDGDIISKASTAVTETKNALGIDIKVAITTNTEWSSNEDKDATASENNNSSKPAQSSSQPIVSSKPTVSSKPATSSQSTVSSKPTASTKPTVSSKPSHTHSYSAGTCTEPKKCSCGDIGGPALGHDYKDGKCSRCGVADPNAVSYTSVAKKVGSWSSDWFFGDFGISASLYIFDGAEDGYMYFTGEGILAGPEELDSEDAVKFSNGKMYILGMGNGGEGFDSVEEIGNTVTIRAGDKKLELQRTGENTLKVLSCTIEFSPTQNLPAGTIFTFSTGEE